jgi:hypothetical protein
LEKKWLEGSTGLGRQVFPLAGTPLENSWLRYWTHSTNFLENLLVFQKIGTDLLLLNQKLFTNI